MGVEKEIAVGLKENYEKVRKLLDEDSKHDPEDEPYSSKYAARAILITMRSTLTSLLESELEAYRKEVYEAMLSSVLLNIGIIAIDTEELTDGEKHLIECLESLKGKDRSPLTVIIAVKALNHLGILWSHRENASESKVFLDKAEELYKNFKESDLKPIDIIDLYCGPEDKPNDQSLISLEKSHTLTLYYLAQIYGNLEDYLKSAVYCHITLKRQLEYNDYEPIDWALNSATLSQFFMEKNGFKQSRHHLSAASCILDKYGEELLVEDLVGEAHDAQVETFKHRSADVARCWVKYGLMLLSNSKDRLMSHTDDDVDDPPCTLSSDLSKLQLSEDSSVSIHDLSDLHFSTLNLSEYETQITDQFILTFEDAKLVFHNVQSWLEKAKKYYTMDNLASDHIQIVQDASQLYRYLAFFEDSEERQAKMHKRRINLLEDIIKDLNPVYYVQLCRQIWYELGETYSNILDIKLEKFQKSEDRPTPQALNKINHLTEQSIKHFNNFLVSLEEPVTHKMPKKFPPDLVKPSLVAYFHIGRLYMKMIVMDKQIQLNNIEETLKAYSKLVEYCDADKTAAEMMTAELGVCREMVGLLPLKIIRLKRELQLPE